MNFPAPTSNVRLEQLAAALRPELRPLRQRARPCSRPARRATTASPSTPPARLQPTGQTTLSLRLERPEQRPDRAAQRARPRAWFLTTPSSNYDPANPSSVTTPGHGRSEPRERPHGRVHGWRRSRADAQLRRRHQLHPSQVRSISPRHSASASRATRYSPVILQRGCGNIVDGSPTCDQASYTGTYFVRGAALPAATVRRNYGSYDTFDGVQLTARKRFSQRWMMSANLAINTGTHYDPEPTRDYTDPTNIAFQNGARTSVVPWSTKFSGALRAAVGYLGSGLSTYRSGFTYNTNDPVAEPSQQPRNGQRPAAGQQRV